MHATLRARRAAVKRRVHRTAARPPVSGGSPPPPSPQPPEGTAFEIGRRGIVAGDPGVVPLLATPRSGADHAGVGAVVTHRMAPLLGKVHEHAGEQLLEN
ncbi:MAG: hypothetical protein GX464_09900 [Holophagae bacterium]|nr:hypothetical protein [Holophagae bacterium]